ncbi:MULTISPECIES: hypothetical protein [unclassified Ensifer]|uniref:hypothetical protein n=1 Tax=unclassified Ensifer TaxID=2633371 RepID=UPI000812D984|nr:MULTISPECIES: hypothetical protein [unclassified Ensifer]OCP21925.1 hypothetical protein BC361_25490 [Ensifer sp. LC54]OCP23295.1 hypothetical protein BC363_25275 [Ensifer sp. LC384]
MKEPETTNAVETAAEPAKATGAPTKAAVRKKPQAMKFLGALTEQPTFTANNMDEKTLRDLNFKVDPEFHARFKMTAAAAGLSMKDLLEEAFHAWIQSRQAPR